MATRIMASFYKVGRDKTQVPVNLDAWTTDVYGYQHWFAREGYTVVNGNVDVRGAHGALIREVAAKGTVILKNNGSLPIIRPRQIAVFGSDATDNPKGPNGCNDRGCADGTVAMGWGSGTANFPYLISPLTALQNKAYQDNSVIQWVVDDYATDAMTATARQADVCLVFVKAQSGEGYITVDGNQGDRNNLTLWSNGEQVIQTVAGNCSNTIVTVHAPGPVLMESWINHPNVTAVLFAGLPGQESGNSIVDVLYGFTEPGRLPFTIAKSASDYGVKLMYEPDNMYAPQQNITNGLMIDYRHFDKNNIEPRFEFGFGLSYTNWTYKAITVRKTPAGPYTPFVGRTPAAKTTNVTESPSSLLFPPSFHKVTAYIYPFLSSTSQYGLDGQGENGPTSAYDPSGTPIRPAGGAPGGNPQLYDVLWQVNVTVANVGSRNGEDVVQLYVSQGEQDDPVRVLRGFRRVSVDAGKWTNVIFDIKRRDVARWDTVAQDWVVTSAKKKVYVGRSSRNLQLVADLD
ncbi:Beta-glucosidase [Orbilia brochopaga]|nr:Beta-glucosidase [Drechslerella brochopaga]